MIAPMIMLLRCLLLAAVTVFAAAAEGVWVPIAGAVGGFEQPVREFIEWRGKLVACGDFRSIGSSQIFNLALRSDDGSWSAIPGSLYLGQGRFDAVAGVDDDLVFGVGPSFDPALERVWRWDGETWTALSGFPADDGQVTSIVACGGDIYVGRKFQAEGEPAVLRWDGTSWFPLPVSGSVDHLATDGVTLYIGGGSLFIDLESVASEVVSWDGSTAAELPSAPGRTIACDGDGILWSAGALVLGRWDGSAWQTVASPAPWAFDAECLSGKVFICGDPSGDHPEFRGISAYDPATASWSSIGYPDYGATTLGVSAGRLLASGNFNSIDDVPAAKVAMLTDTGWESLAPAGTAGEATACAWRAGQLYVGGSFRSIGSVVSRNLATWDGAAWHDIGADAPINAMATDGSGRLWIAGFGLTRVAGIEVRGVAWLDDGGWHAAGTGLTGYFNRLCPDGDAIVVCGAPMADDAGTIRAIAARWDGAAWEMLGSPSTYGGAAEVVRDSAGDLVAVGNFLVPDGAGEAAFAARWDGSAWHQLGTGLTNDGVGDPRGITRLDDGRLLVVGYLQVDGENAKCALWDGTAWTAGPHLSDPIRLLAWRGRTLAVSYAGPSLHEFVDGGWSMIASEAGYAVPEPAVWEDRVALVGPFSEVDGRACAGVVLVDLAPPAAPEVVVDAEAEPGSLTITMPLGSYDVRPIGGEWEELGSTDSVTLASSSSAVLARAVRAEGGDGWELQRIDGPAEYSAKLLIHPDGSTTRSTTGGGTVSLGDATVSQGEGGASALVTVNRTGGTAGSATVHYAASAGTASAADDFTAASGTLTWGPGEDGARTFTVAIADDALVEDDETVVITLSAPGGAALGLAAGDVVIVNDDAPPPPGPVTIVPRAGGDVEVSGNDVVGSILELLVDGTMVATVTVSGAGEWSELLDAVNEGSHVIEVRSRRGGATSGATAPVTVVADATPPAAPGVSTMSVVGSTVHLSGFAEALSAVTVEVDGVERGIADVPVGGTWSFALAGTPAGPHAVLLRSIDAAGNAGPGTEVEITVAAAPGTDAGTGPSAGDSGGCGSGVGVFLLALLAFGLRSRR